MNMDATVRLVEALSWPLTLLVIVILLRHEMRAAIGRLKKLEGPTGWKMQFEVVREGLANLKKMATDIYDLTGEPLQVREEIYTYVAEILTRVSPETALEMGRELNRYHLQRLKVSASEIKEMLRSLHFYEQSDSGEAESEIGPSFVQAVLRYQQSKNMSDADGIVGPKTITFLREDIARRAQPAARADG